MGTKIKILIVEDNRIVLLNLKNSLENNSLDIDIEVLTASNIEQARVVYILKRDDLSIIIMDFDLGGGIDTEQLTREIKKTFKRPIIANSSDQLSNGKLIEAGCTHRSKSKDECPEKVFEIISEFKKYIIV